MDHPGFPYSTPEHEKWHYNYSDGDPSQPLMDDKCDELCSAPISQQSSGYSSNMSGCSGSSSNSMLISPDSHRSLSHTRGSSVPVNEGSVIHFNSCNIIINAPSAPHPGVHNQTERLDMVRSEPTVPGRGHRGDIPTCHLSPHNEKLLHHFTPDLVESMDANALLPYLMHHGLANRNDQDYISNHHRTNQERNMYIIRTVPYKDSNAFERFVTCLEEVGSEVASHLRKGMIASGCTQRLKLTAFASVWLRDCSVSCGRLIYTAMLGEHEEGRTLCVEGMTNASWNFKFEFRKFATTDTLEIGVWQENTCPNDLLGMVRIPILAVTDKRTNAVHPGHETEASFPLKSPGSGKIAFNIYTDVTNGNSHTDKR